MKRAIGRNTALLTLCIAILCIPLIAIGLFVYGKHQWVEQRMDELEPRYARLAGLAAGRDELEKAEAAAAARLAEYAYPASAGLTQAGNDAQQRIRTIFTEAGLQLVSSQVLPAKDEKQFDRIPLTIRLEGDLKSLQAALLALSRQSPAILLDGLNVQTIGVVKAETAQRLGTQFSLSVLRVKP